MSLATALGAPPTSDLDLMRHGVLIDCPVKLQKKGRPGVRELCGELGYSEAKSLQEAAITFRKSFVFPGDSRPGRDLSTWDKRPTRVSLYQLVQAFLEHPKYGRRFWSPESRPATCHLDHVTHREKILNLLVLLFWRQSEISRDNKDSQDKARKRAESEPEESGSESDPSWRSEYLFVRGPDSRPESSQGVSDSKKRARNPFEELVRQQVEIPSMAPEADTTRSPFEGGKKPIHVTPASNENVSKTLNHKKAKLDGQGHSQPDKARAHPWSATLNTSMNPKGSLGGRVPGQQADRLGNDGNQEDRADPVPKATPGADTGAPRRGGGFERLSSASGPDNSDRCGPTETNAQPRHQTAHRVDHPMHGNDPKGTDPPAAASTGTASSQHGFPTYAYWVTKHVQPESVMIGWESANLLKRSMQDVVEKVKEMTGHNDFTSIEFVLSSVNLKVNHRVGNSDEYAFASMKRMWQTQMVQSHQGGAEWFDFTITPTPCPAMKAVGLSGGLEF